MRLALMLAGLAVAAATANAFGDVGSVLGGSGDTGKGPLIIHIQRSNSLSQGSAVTVKQTRCVVQWSGLERGTYDKQCSASTLRR